MKGFGRSGPLIIPRASQNIQVRIIVQELIPSNISFGIMVSEEALSVDYPDLKHLLGHCICGLPMYEYVVLSLVVAVH